MELNSGVSMILPDSIGLMENEFEDHEDIVHEQTNQNEIVELIMAAFEEHDDEPSDDESLNTSTSSDQSLDEQSILNNNNHIDEHYVQEQNELHPHQQALIPSIDVHGFEITDNEHDNIEEELPNHLVFYPNPTHTSTPTIEMTDPIQAQYFYQTSSKNLNDTHKLRILCNAKERKICQLENLCEEYREKYEIDIQTLEQKLELNERSKYDLINTQCEDLIEKNNQLHRTIKDMELLTESLHEKINDYEFVLSTTREELENIQMNLQEKNNELDELRVQLETENKNNEKNLFQRIETINHLNDELNDYQQKYRDLVTETSFNQKELTRMAEEKEKLEYTRLELQSEIRTLREHDINNSILNQNKSSVFDENIQLKKHIEELQRKIVEYEFKSQRSDSDSSTSSNGSSKTVITTSVHREQIRNLTNQIEKLKKDYADLEEKYDYEKHELQTMIEQLREDVIDLDKTKQLYIDVCQEKNSIEDKLRSQFEFELKSQTDNLYRILEKEHNEKLKFYKNNQDNDTHPTKHNQDSEQQTNELYQEVERLKAKHEKQISELNDEIDRLRDNDHAKNRLLHIEKDYEKLKHDYYNLNIKQKQLLSTYLTLEKENQNLLNSIDQIDQEKLQLKTTYKNEEEKLLHEIKQLNELNEHQRQELLTINKETDYSQIHLKQDIDALQLRINNYENAISQYEEYRVKLEANLQKIGQQRDAHKVDLRLTQELLANKEEEYNQLKTRCDEYQKHLQMNEERFIPYENTINDLQRQLKQYELQIQELNQTRSAIIQETELQYREKLVSLDTEKCQFEELLQEANRALNLADSHLQQEIEKIKTSLEQEYNRRYERDHKQHQQDLHQSRQHVTNTEEIKKMYRTEIDRLSRENIELSQHQSKLIDTHQKQMQIMKKELDDGYKNIINEFQREQTRLQTRYDQLKQQLTVAQHTIEQLRSSLNQLKTSHFDDMSKVKEAYTIEYDHKARKDNLQHRLENLIKLLEQSNDALIQERTLHAHQENEYQQTITSLQKKIGDMIKQHTKAIDEIKYELQYERSTNQKRLTFRPVSVPDFNQTNSSSNNLITIEKLRELLTIEMLALLRLICKMIFDMHHKIITAHHLDSIEISIKKLIQNELIRSRNSMIKDFRREIFEKITQALRSQGVPDRTIDKHIFEIDRLLSQMAQDCLDSLTTSQSSSNSSVSSFTTFPSSSSTKALAKSIECLYMTPTMTQQPVSLSSNSRSILDVNRRPKSASNTLIASQNSTPLGISSPYIHRFQQSTHRNFRMKMYRSEDDIMLAVQRNELEKIPSDSDDDTLTLSGNEDEIHQSKQNITNTNQQEEDDDDKRARYPQTSSPIPSTQKNGIKKFVRNGLKLFTSQSHQHKKAGK